MESLPILISICALLFSLYQFLSKKNNVSATQITTVIVKLESIGEGVNEIKEDLKTVHSDLLELRERVAIVEQRAKSNTSRLDLLDGRKSE